MKNLLLIVLIFSTPLSVFSQDTESESAIQKGNILLDVGLVPFFDGTAFKGNSTGISYLSTDGSDFLSVGADGGYFISDGTAIKLGLGFTDLDGAQYFSYRVGFKHYAGGNIPLQLDVTGATNEDFPGFETPDPLWLGMQGGYAIFITPNISFEPTIRYDLSLNSDFSDENIFQLHFNFVLFF